MSLINLAGEIVVHVDSIRYIKRNGPFMELHLVGADDDQPLQIVDPDSAGWNSLLTVCAVGPTT
jgi:hypothetical protein